MQVKNNAIVSLTPAADQSAKEGYFVTNSLGTATVSSSAADIPFGVILDGEDTDGQSSVAVCGGFAGTCKVKASGTILEGALLQLHTDGSVITDAASGARVIVGRALEAAASGELIEAVIFRPDARS